MLLRVEMSLPWNLGMHRLPELRRRQDSLSLLVGLWEQLQKLRKE